MSSKVNGLTCLSSVLRNKRPKIPPLFCKSQPLVSSIPLPDGPGCSRWFSCSCCRPNISKRTFFTSNHLSEACVVVPPVTKGAERLSPEEEQRPIHFMPDTPVATPHLPLPPTLPYSPNSHPFQRHLSILSLSLLSPDTDKSWLVYTAIHPSLHRHLPDETFRALLAKQTSHGDEKEAWKRVRELLLLGKRCEMDLEEIGKENLEKCLSLGLDLALRAGKTDPKTVKLLRKLWKGLASLSSNLGAIPLHLRQDWLNLQAILIDLRQTHETRAWRLNRQSPMEETILEMVERSGLGGLGPTVGRILLRMRGGSEEGLKQSLRLLAWSVNKKAEVKMEYVVKVMTRLGALWNTEGQDGMRILELEIDTILKEVEALPGSPAAELFGQALRNVEGKINLLKNTLSSLDDRRLDYGSLTRKGFELCAKAKRVKENEILPIVNATLRLLEIALQYPEEDPLPLITSISKTLHQFLRSPLSPCISPPIVRLTQLILQARMLPALPSHVVVPLFRLIIAALPSDDAYILSRKVYEFARTANPPFTWSESNTKLWRSLFQSALSHDRKHIHFASRLYTDYISDGLPVRRTDALLMIRSIGSKPSPSRPILLERHIKDYLWFAYGRRPALVKAVVQGLTSVGVRDSELALNLAQRLSLDKELQPLVILMIIGQLARSSLPSHREKCFALLHQLSSTTHAEETKWAYNTVLSYLVSSALPFPQHAKTPHKEIMRLVLSVYKNMIDRGITPDGRTAGTIIRMLTDHGLIDEALSVFGSCLDRGLAPKSHAIGRMMVRLALARRFEEALQVESRWREATTGKNSQRGIKAYDKGVIGARLLVDMMMGKSVDLDAAARKGWEGNKEFLEFLETLKPKQDGAKEEAIRVDAVEKR